MNSSMLGYNVWFTSDNHIRHKNIIKHCPERFRVMGLVDENEIEKHDQWIIDMWNRSVAKKDHVYIVGDFSFANVEWTQRIMGKLNGKKFLITGNHDKTCSKIEMRPYFEDVCHIKEVIFKKAHWDFLEEDFRVFMCHYPMVTWADKHWGAVEAHGHCHGRLDDYNDESPDLRVDVGIDGRLANYSMVSLEQLYRHFKGKTGGQNFQQYTNEKKLENSVII